MVCPSRYASPIPLPATAFLPGGPRPEPTVDARLTEPRMGYFFAVDLYNHGFYWEAHEQWESLWRTSRDSVSSAFLKSLIQQAAAGVHWRLGAPSSCHRLGWRSMKYLAVVAGAHADYGFLDVFHWLRRWQTYLEAGYRTQNAPPKLCLNLDLEPPRVIWDQAHFDRIEKVK